MVEVRTWVKIPDLSEMPKVLPCLVYCKPQGDIGQAKSWILSLPELAKADSLLPQSRRIYCAAHVVLRLVLAHFTGIAPEILAIANLVESKPFLPNHTLKFNLSHTENAFLIAVSNQEIGVDIEEIQKDLDFEGIMDFAFSESDKMLCDKHDLPNAFTQMWTLKEAYTKAIGTGLSENLSEINISGPKSVLNQDGYCSSTFICPGNEIGSVVCGQDLTGLLFFELL
jgi:phosphopantetheinyl transferase